jgi:hypothetical protein
VGKRQPLASIEFLYQLGQRAFGENYLQEAEARMAALANREIEWHFIGAVQTNKTRQIARQFDWVQGVDRLRVAERLSTQRGEEHPTPLNVCLQVNISGEDSKAGVAPAALPELALTVAALPNLRLRGLMAIPAPAARGEDARAAFDAMAGLFSALRSMGLELDCLSMGMSADLESAIAAGSTMVRVGTDLFGPRPPTSVPHGTAKIAP